MGFECAYSVLGNVAAVDIRGDELEGGSPVFSDDAAELVTGFIVEYLMVNGVTF